MTPILFSQTAKLLLLFLLFQSETAARTVNFLKGETTWRFDILCPMWPFWSYVWSFHFFFSFVSCRWGSLLHNFFFWTRYFLQSFKETSYIYISVRRNDFPRPSGKILIQVHVDCKFSTRNSWVVLTGPRHSTVCHHRGQDARTDRK